MKSPIIRLENVTVRYHNIAVLESINIDINTGDFLAVLGPNGGGKTTLLKVILGLIEPDEGSIRIFGDPVAELNKHRQNIGYVPQISSADQNFPAKVKDVVMMGRYGKIGLFKRPGRIDKKAVESAMERIKILDIADVPVSRLSGGQRQRVFLARALATEPEILILDEPTTGVDSMTSESLYELLHELHDKNITILIVSHDIGVVASHVTSITCLNKKMVAHGRPDEVVSSKELTEMYGCEAIPVLHEQIPHIAIKSHTR